MNLRINEWVAGRMKELKGRLNERINDQLNE